MHKILLDTDFLLNSLKFKIDIISELRRLLDYKINVNILDKTLDEIKKKNQVRLVLKFIKNKNISVIKTNSNKRVDDLLLDYGNAGFIIATLDKMLKKILKEKNIKIITIRQKKYLVFS